jgi:hypothetical protein
VLCVVERNVVGGKHEWIQLPQRTKDMSPVLSWFVILFRGGGSKDFVGGCHRSCVITDRSWGFTKGGES